jgi:hypothetical protein
MLDADRDEGFELIVDVGVDCVVGSQREAKQAAHARSQQQANH